MNLPNRSRLHLLFAALLAGDASSRAADQPQWGAAWTRNMVSSERGLPDSFDPKTGANVKWSVPLGTQTYSSPIIAGGRVYIGTNNEEPRDPAKRGDAGVLLCLDEIDGHLLWQLVVPKREEDPYLDWPKTGWSSPVTVEGNRVYTVSNRGEVLCLDANGMANGNNGPFRDEGAHMTPRGTNAPAQPYVAGMRDADIVWLFNMPQEVGIWTHDGAHSSILIHGNFLYVNTGTGVDNTHKVIRAPDSPSLIVLDKRTGRLVARDDEHIAPDVFHCTWSSPSLAKVDGRELVFFAGGNGVLYAFEPVAKSAPASQTATLKKVWQLDFDPAAPKENIHSYLSNRRVSPSNIYGMPVFDQGRLYVAGGGDWFWGKNEAWLKCFDPRGAGVPGTNALIWSYPLGRHTMSTPAVQDGLAYAADSQHTLHCVDTRTGQAVWTHDIGGEVWASPLVADGKVYLGTRNGIFWVLNAGREKQVLGRVELGDAVNSTATAANGVVYVTTMKRLFAVRTGPSPAMR
jgi:outer membrane protein assembly factor BamB